ncbi:hypothetical protein SAMN05216480_102298 [Pustulibacterium marinum]|uniref:MetA-pathway of phenol degradation n=1 Tax=Pustulibacterium marinum TaxID=1224947 RepID=A0A1I7FWL0_9FLAO|nr:DUF6588 family protein [Pustulibacterium marinum]SFU40533.1 hypothetical protein SAMN05216480_102298 [Pustulibacterium marinum]
MKSILLTLVTAFSISSYAQDASSIFTTGLEDSQRFAKGYLQPGSEAIGHAMNNGWFNSAEAKSFLAFEISIIGNIVQVDEADHTFNFEASTTGGLSYADGSSIKSVASVLGTVDPDIVMEYTITEPNTGMTETIQITLPEGILDKNINNVPAGYLQGSIGLLKGTELKLRFLPKIDINDRKFGVLGIGVQHEFTEWLPADKLWPIAISGLVAYTKLNADYNVDDVLNLDGVNQYFQNDTQTWLFQSIFSTKLPVINFYGGVGYMTGTSKSDLKGTYIVYEGFGTQATVEDPISVENEISGVRATLGTKLKLGFFRLNADYTFAEFNSATIGLNFGFR